MARITVFIPDDVMTLVGVHRLQHGQRTGFKPPVSKVVTEALAAYLTQPSRPEASERGRTETLRAVRAARDALRDVEATLTQAKPVKRRVRRYPVGQRVAG